MYIVQVHCASDIQTLKTAMYGIDCYPYIDPHTPHCVRVFNVVEWKYVCVCVGMDGKRMFIYWHWPANKII